MYFEHRNTLGSRGLFPDEVIVEVVGCVLSRGGANGRAGRGRRQ